MNGEFQLANRESGRGPEFGCGGRKRGGQGGGVAAGDPDLDGARPAGDLGLDPDLEHVVVREGLGAEHQAMVELRRSLKQGEIDKQLSFTKIILELFCT